MKTTQMTPFFHLLFLLYLLVTFISEFENTLNSFSNSLLQSILVCKIPQFFTKSYRFTQLIILFLNVSILRLLKIYIIFCFPAGAKYHFFRPQLINYIGGWRKFHKELVWFFITFWWQKKFLRALLTCTFICLLLSSLDLHSYSLRKRYTLRMLCCCV